MLVYIKGRGVQGHLNNVYKNISFGLMDSLRVWSRMLETPQAALLITETNFQPFFFAFPF